MIMRSKKFLLSAVAIVVTTFIFSCISNNVTEKQHYQARTIYDQIHAQGINGAVQWLNLLRYNPETGTISYNDILKARQEMLRFAQESTQKKSRY